MNAKLLLLGLVLCATSLLAAAQGQSQPAKPSCVSFPYNPKFLTHYPKAASACQEVVTKEGQQWARFDGTVTAVKNNQVTTSIIDEFGHPMQGHLILTATPDEKVTMNGKEQGWSTLAVGDKLSLWMPESVIGFYAKPGSLSSGKLTITKGL
jgi:hypothetical protein